MMAFVMARPEQIFLKCMACKGDTFRIDDTGSGDDCIRLLCADCQGLHIINWIEEKPDRQPG
jgi:hypothetical protein